MVRGTKDSGLRQRPYAPIARQHYGGIYHKWHRMSTVTRTQCGAELSRVRMEWTFEKPTTGRLCKRCFPEEIKHAIRERIVGTNIQRAQD